MPLYNLTADGDQEVGGINIKREFSVAVSGDFGGGTLNVQYGTTPGTFTNYVSGDTGTFTADGERVFTQCGNVEAINLNLAGSTAPDLTVIVQELR
jgi:hypothetical protein